MHLELGRVLGESLGDRPAAVARLRGIPDEAPEAIAARGLEGRLRARLGDASGATLAFARLRERAGREPTALPWLEEAARFEEERGGLHAAQQHLAVAIGISPGDPDLETRYRRLGEQIAARAGVRAPYPSSASAPRAAAAASPSSSLDDVTHALPGTSIDDAVTHALPGAGALDDAVTHALPGAGALDDAATHARPAAGALDDAATHTRPGWPASASPDALDDLTLADGGTYDAEAEARVESLTRTLQGDPTNDEVASELTVLLTRLGRSMELLALLSARLEDAPPDRREALLPRHREVLTKLESDARAAGRDAEADLFRMARDAT